MDKFFYDVQSYTKPDRDQWDGVLIELTDYCNLNCPFCLNGSSKANNSFISFDDFKYIIDQIKGNVSVVQLSGGEPLTNPSFMSMVDYLINEGVPFHINTNGILVTESLLDKIINYPKASIQFSLDGASEYTDDSIRCKGHYKKIVHLMQYLSASHFKRGDIKMVINRINRHEVKDNFALALQYGFLPTYSFLVRSGRADDNWDTLYLDDREKYEVRNMIWELLDSNVDYFKEFQMPSVLHYLRNMNISYVGECQFNLEHFRFNPYIRTNGDVYPCQGLFDDEFCIGNLLRQTPDEIFTHNNVKVQQLAERVKKRRIILENSICRTCPINKTCGKGCIAESYNEGDFYGKPADCYFRKRDFLMGIKGGKA